MFNKCLKCVLMNRFKDVCEMSTGNVLKTCYTFAGLDSMSPADLTKIHDLLKVFADDHGRPLKFFQRGGGGQTTNI